MFHTANAFCRILRVDTEVASIEEMSLQKAMALGIDGNGVPFWCYENNTKGKSRGMFGNANSAL